MGVSLPHMQRALHAAPRTHWIVLDHIDHDGRVGDSLPMRLQSDAPHGQHPRDCRHRDPRSCAQTPYAQCWAPDAKKG